MSKQSGGMAKQQAIQQGMISKTERVTCELMSETLWITIHEEFGWGYDRIAKLDCLWKECFLHFQGALHIKNPEADVLQEHLDRRLAGVYRDRQPMPPFEDRFPEIKPITYGKK